MDMYYSSVPSCVIMDTLRTCIIVVYLVVLIMDTLWTCIILVYIVLSLWTNCRHVL